MKTYHTLDWETEARLIADAFQLNGDYEFRSEGTYFENENRLHIVGQTREASQPMLSDGSKFHAVYTEEYRYFSITMREYNVPLAFSSAHILWDGDLKSRVNADSYQWEMARGLYRLSLLTPEIKNALSAKLSAHEKMEWGLEFAIIGECVA